MPPTALPVIPADRADDLHHLELADDADLVLFMAGNQFMADRIMEEKRAEGTTIFTRVHHRETPLRISLKTVDAGPVWQTEIIHARRGGLPFAAVEPGPELDQRHRVNYHICPLSSAPHTDAAERFVAFIASPEAAAIYRDHGFTPHAPAPKPT